MTTDERVLTEDDWTEVIEGMRSGKPVQIDEGVFGYFLEVLPPAYMSRTVTLPNGDEVRAAFGFAEGEENIVAFWKKDGAYWCCRTDEINKGM